MWIFSVKQETKLSAERKDVVRWDLRITVPICRGSMEDKWAADMVDRGLGRQWIAA